MEEWRSIPGYSGYEVSDFGRVRSLDRIIDSAGDDRREPYRRWYPGRLLSVRPDSQGYLRCSHVGRVHVLIMLAFVGMPPEGMEVCHINGDQTDNRLENLRYGTRANNMEDAIVHGTTTRGEKNAMAVLTTEQVLAIKHSKDNATVLANRYGISEQHARRIRRGARWGWL